MKKIILKMRILTLVAVFCSGFLVSASTANARQETPSAGATASLKTFLGMLDADKTAQYLFAFRDLNDDGTPEAIVRLSGNNWCGSGGCNTLILTPDKDSWKIVTNIRITQPPVYVLPGMSKGWRHVGVRVQGGGIQPGYVAELRFNGKTYPRNPSVPPARRLQGKPGGEVLILDELRP